MRRALVAGNWKMNGRRADLAQAQAVAAAGATGVDVVICPPVTLLAAMADLVGDGIGLGAQDCSTRPDGAHTGDLSAAMLADAGAQYVILGHSERRRDHGETDALVRAKAEAALAVGLKPIVCVGETFDERQAGDAEAVVAAQIEASLPVSAEGLVLAYEPVWAIGSGLTPTLTEIEAIHAVARASLRRRLGAAADAVRILYGGSVKATNAGDIFRAAGVDGALVGGASLKSTEFLSLIRSHPAAGG